MSCKIVGIGEVLLDLLPTGPQLGGAPANFAYHARQLGAQARVITRVGSDAHGKKILERIGEMGIENSAVQVDDRLPTGTATVALEKDGVPRFTINDSAAWDNLEFTKPALDAVQTADAVCFGTLGQRNLSAASSIQQLVAAAPGSSLKVIDINLRQKFYTSELIERSLQIANVLKLNEHELTVLSAIYGLKGDAGQKIERLVRLFDLELVALTRGENGSLLCQAGNWSDLPGRKTTEIVDTVGAGDAFTAALVIGLLSQFGLEDIHRIAADVAGFVCSQPGATPALPPHLRAAFVPNCTSV
jgi:fructokinase